MYFRTVRDILKICRILHMLLIHTEVKIGSGINTYSLLAMFKFRFSVGADSSGCLLIVYITLTGS